MEQKKQARNLWCAIRSEELEALLIRVSRDEKSNWEKRSDFEKLAFFCQNRDSILGSRAERLATKAWRDCLRDVLPPPSSGIDRTYACLAWQEGNRRLDPIVSEMQTDENIVEKTCDEKEYVGEKKETFANNGEKCYTKSLLITPDFLISHAVHCQERTVFDLAKSFIDKDIEAVLIDGKELPFCRPDPYHAQVTLDRLLNGEKYKEQDLSILYYQIILSICEIRKNQKLQFDMVWLTRISRPSTAQLAEYLILRRLDDRWLFTVWDGEDAEIVLDSKTLFLRSSFSLLLCFDDGGDQTEKAARMLADLYPIGLLVDHAERYQIVLKKANIKSALPTLLSLWNAWRA